MSAKECAFFQRLLRILAVLLQPLLHPPWLLHLLLLFSFQGFISIAFNSAVDGNSVSLDWRESLFKRQS